MRLLMEFWPALLPLFGYVAWLGLHRRRADAAGAPRMRFRDGPWYWAVLASLLVAGLLFVLLGLSAPEVKGRYAPPHLQNGQIVPGQVQP